MPYIPLHHKYRPQTFADLVGQSAIATTLTNALNANRIAPAYLFTGPRGTGKTSSARILAKSLNCLNSSAPTATPCGECDVCQSIALGAALDVIEIDAASNTGVDNIREIIERAQYAPVQCRYKVYTIDECLTGDTLVSTSTGWMRIDNPALNGQKVLSYNESTRQWEYKQVRRWLDRGENDVLTISTNNRQIRCTANHLIRTDRGWLPAKDLMPGMKILSPVNAGAAVSSTNSAQMESLVGSCAVINSKEILTGKKVTIESKSYNKQNYCDLSVVVAANKSSKSQHSSNKKGEVFAAFNLTGKDILISKDMDCGLLEQKSCSNLPNRSHQRNSDLSAAPYWGMQPLPTPTSTVDFPDWHGRTVKNSASGWNIKARAYQSCDQNSVLSSIRATGIDRLPVKLSAIPSLEISSTSLDRMAIVKSSLGNGLMRLHPQELFGGISMMVRSISQPKAVPASCSIRKATLQPKTKLSSIGSLPSAMMPASSITPEAVPIDSITTSTWVLTPPENSWQISSSTLSPQWTTNLETIESVCPAGSERVYDLEVDDNHNFVANGLLVHNCHMLSTAAFNSLLKTLEEPPPHVVFILATTDPQRVLPTIISRCQRFDYRRIGVTDMVEHLSYIAQQENISIEPAAILPIAQLSQGGLRDAESLLDRLSLLDGEITPERVWEISGTVGERDLLDLLKAIATNNPEQLLDRLRGLLARGKEPLTILQSLAGCYRDLAIAKTAPNRQDLVIFTAEGWQELCEIATEWQLSAILSGQVALKESESQLKQTTQPYLWLEVSCLGLFPTAQIAPVITQVTAPTPPVSQLPRAQVIQTPTPPVAQTPSPTNLAEIWQQTLDRLPKSSQSLLAQYGSPIDITTEQAIVGLKTNTFLKIAEGKIPELTKAFTEVLGRSIQVKLTLANAAPAPQSATAPVATPPNPQIPAPTPPSLPSPHAPTTHAEPDEYLTDDDEISDDEEPEPVAPLEPVEPAPAMAAPVEQPRVEFQPASEPAAAIVITPTDIALQAATDRLIQLFGGEVADDLDRYSETDG